MSTFIYLQIILIVDKKGGKNLLLNIFSRTKALGLDSNDIINELSKRGVVCQPTTYSSAIGGKLTTPKAQLIVQKADEILKELESKKHGNTASNKGQAVRT